MEAIKFDLYGKYAFFKNPESNLGTEFSFEHIHKPVILGIIGAIVGLNGKSTINISKIVSVPEYYKILKNIKIAIVPKKPIFNKYIETITNSTGFANKNSTQIITKKILQDVKWTIYIAKDSIDKEIYEKLFKLLDKHESSYPLYLGNNNYKARIANVEIVNIERYKGKLEEMLIDSIFPQEVILENYEECITDDIDPYNLTVYVPNSLNKYNLYEYIWVEYTNCLLDFDKNYINNLYISKNEILYFI